MEGIRAFEAIILHRPKILGANRIKHLRALRKISTDSAEKPVEKSKENTGNPTVPSHLLQIAQPSVQDALNHLLSTTYAETAKTVLQRAVDG